MSLSAYSVCCGPWLSRAVSECELDESWQLPCWTPPWDSQGAPAKAANQDCADPAVGCALPLFLRSALLLLFFLSTSTTTGPGHCISDELLQEAGITGISILSHAWSNNKWREKINAFYISHRDILASLLPQSSFLFLLVLLSEPETKAFEGN